MWLKTTNGEGARLKRAGGILAVLLLARYLGFVLIMLRNSEHAKIYKLNILFVPVHVRLEGICCH